MSSVLVAPDFLQAAAADVAQIGSAVSAGNLAAALPTTQIAAAGGDEISAAIAALFGSYGREFQATAARLGIYSADFVRTLSAAAGSYADEEATIATSLQSMLGAANAPGALHGNALLGGAAPLLSPLNAIGQAWINSPFGRVLDPIINAYSQALLGRDLIGTGGTAGNHKSIVIEFVRHGETLSNAAGLIDTGVPGPGLDALGLQQANAIGAALSGQGPFAGIFTSQLLRSQQTAFPLAGLNSTVLPGLNEISAGVFDGMPQISPAGLLYLAGPVAWTLGFPGFPMLAPGATMFNGVAFDHGFTGALQTMYNTALANPVVAANGKITDVAFSSAFTIEVGTLMNVNNPDPFLMLTHPLPNTGTVVVSGNPTDGWTLVSWDGVPVPKASLPTQLFVDVRDLITAPQFAAYDILTALPTGNPATILNAIGTGVDQVVTATALFPLHVVEDVAHAVTGTLSNL
jgi:broad specificity phosphatase PhoE